MMAAKQGVLGMSMTNTEALVVPTFGKTPMVGTNPIAVTMPAAPYPLHVDMATSVVPAGKMEVYNKKGLSVPRADVNSEGEVTTNPGEFIEIRKNKQMEDFFRWAVQVSFTAAIRVMLWASL